MRDSLLKLQDKTILLIGPFNGVTQALLRTLTEFGADVAYVSEPDKGIPKYIEGVNELRHVHPESGRAAHFSFDPKSRDIGELLGRIVEGLGRMDVLIEASPLSWKKDEDPAPGLEMANRLAEALVPFFQVKKRGRIIFLFEDPSLVELKLEGFNDGYQSALVTNLKVLARAMADRHVTVNGLGLGITEDFLLKMFPKSPSIRKALESLKADHAGARLVEFTDVAVAVAYLASAGSSGLTGQVLRLTHGIGI